ncbi:D-glycero-alpha-D-manno-heptose-1,7-bisphosphate 7-phosphatase [Brevibacterium renqingii]|uniref:D-glycero-alpha-D-manno-heptose-1,7-bisphosphate 7-phosphatase n=1 Tax=Brevibacterium renqingii TaxID=2776916 RepID=UPI003F525305
MPYNGDPDRVVAADTAAEAVALARAAGVPIGVISNQSGIGRGLISADQLHAVNRRVDELLGPFDVWRHCPHLPEDGCRCRKPAAGMLLSAAEELDAPIAEAVMIGDIGADVQAARAAGCRGILVPTQRTLPQEVAAAETVAGTLLEAVCAALGRSAESAGAGASAHSGLDSDADCELVGGAPW